MFLLFRKIDNNKVAKSSRMRMYKIYDGSLLLRVCANATETKLKGAKRVKKADNDEIYSS